MKANSVVLRTAILMVAFSVSSVVLTGQSTIVGTTDIPALLKEAPGLPKDLVTAAKRAFGEDLMNMDHEAADRFYSPFEAKVNSRLEEYQAIAQARMADSGTEEEYYNQVMHDVNSSPIIANMGGIEKISEMSEEEAEEAAIKAAAAYASDMYGAPGQSAGMEALMRKMASDPDYAERFENMSDAEKEVEMRKYMPASGPPAKTSVQMTADKAKMAEQQREMDLIRNAQEIQMKVAEWGQTLSAITLAYGEEVNKISLSPGNHREIDADFQARYAKIPIIEIGEGTEPDPALTSALRIETAKKHQARAAEELKLFDTALQGLARNYMQFATEYMAYIKQNKDKIYTGTTPADMMHGKNTELTLIQFESMLIQFALDLSQQSRRLTKETGQWERQYQQIN